MSPAERHGSNLHPHQRRALALIERVQPGGHREVSIPESSRRIDLLVPVRASRRAWGVLRRDLADRPVALEYHSRPPSPAELAGSLVKTAWCLQSWLRGTWKSPRPPLGLVVSVGTPVSALECLRLLRPDTLAGVHRTCQPGLELILVDVTRLDADLAGTAFLRALDHRPGVRAENMRRLQAASELGNLREAIGDMVMKQPELFSPEERLVTAKTLRAEGHAEGRAEEARRLARRLLVVLLGEPLPPELDQALAGCSDCSTLEQVAELAVRTRSKARLTAGALDLLLPRPRRAKRPRPRASSSRR